MKNIKFLSIIYFIGLLLISISTILINLRLLKSSQQQVMLHLDFNYFQSDLKTPLDLIENFIDDFPNLNATLIPIKIAKANYFIQNKQYEKAKKLSREGKKHNPYLYLTEFQLGRINLLENKFDSAYYYLTRASKGLPLNTTHATWAQRVIGGSLKKQELDSLLEYHIKRNNTTEAMWQNHLLMTTFISGIENTDFNDNDKRLAKKASELFPNNLIINENNQVINFGAQKILIVNALDKEAKMEFENKNYQKAIELWENCIELIDNDYAYYFNIALSHYGLENFDTSIEFLSKSNNLMYANDNGKIEELMGMNYLSKKDTLQACKHLKNSSTKLSKKTSKVIGCYD